MVLQSLAPPPPPSVTVVVILSIVIGTVLIRAINIYRIFIRHPATLLNVLYAFTLFFFSLFC